MRPGEMVGPGAPPVPAPAVPPVGPCAEERPGPEVGKVKVEGCGPAPSAREGECAPDGNGGTAPLLGMRLSGPAPPGAAAPEWRVAGPLTVRAPGCCCDCCCCCCWGAEDDAAPVLPATPAAIAAAVAAAAAATATALADADAAAAAIRALRRVAAEGTNPLTTRETVPPVVTKGT